MNPSRFSRTEPAASRRVVASFDRYEDAERAIDMLADRKFPVEHTAIVARDLEYVEQVTGRMTYARAALNGLIGGALVGFLIGWLFGVFDWFNPIVSAFWLAIDGLWFGALVGAVFGLIAHALTGGRRDFAASGAMRAHHYDVTVDEPYADEAARELSGTAGSPATRDERGAAPSEP